MTLIRRVVSVSEVSWLLIELVTLRRGHSLKTLCHDIRISRRQPSHDSRHLAFHFSFVLALCDFYGLTCFGLFYTIWSAFSCMSIKSLSCYLASVGLRSIVMSRSVCLIVLLSVHSHNSKTVQPNFSKCFVCCMWSWPSLMALRYVLYLRFYRWRQWADAQIK